MSRLVPPSLSGESAVPELHGSPVLVTATSHLLLCGESLPHDAAGEAPAVFHLEVRPPSFNTQADPRNHDQQTKRNS